MYLKRLSMFEPDNPRSPIHFTSYMTVHIDGQDLEVRVVTNEMEYRSYQGSRHFVESIQAQMRRSIEREISKQLFKGLA